MAWIESHQALSKHRKTLRAAALLRVDRHLLIGHLHELWWWGLDNVPADGNLGDLSDEEIAAGAEWPGDPAEFVAALTTAGFIDQTPEGRFLHDWYDYAGKYLEQKARDAERKRSERRRTSTGCPPDVRWTSGGRPPDVRQYLTIPNHTIPNHEDIETEPPKAVQPDGDKVQAKAEYTDDFEAFWSAYPKKIGKKAAYDKWRTRIRQGVTPGELIMAAKHYATACAQDHREMRFVMQAETFLGPKERWKDYIDPPTQGQPTRASPKQGSSNVLLRREREPDRYDFLYRKFDGGPGHETG